MVAEISGRIYVPGKTKSYRLSRSRIEEYIRCSRCFFLERRHGIQTPPSFPFTLNYAVDKLLKKEFDYYRKQKIAHPLMKKYAIDAVPFGHEKMNEWRDNLRGISYYRADVDLILFGAIDDLWINSNDELMIVDYKATSVENKIDLDAEWKNTYKRQIEIYQWLFRKNGYAVSDTGYFVYANALKTEMKFDNLLKFDTIIIPYRGNSNWIDKTIQDIHQCLNQPTAPPSNLQCVYCSYSDSIAAIVKK